MQVHLKKIKRSYWGFDWIHPETGYVLSPYIAQGKKLYVVYYNGKAVFFDTFQQCTLLNDVLNPNKKYR